MATEPLRIGTRASQLALTQTGWVAERLRTWTEDVAIVEVSTRGDLRQDTPIHRFGGDGVFVRELEQALLDGRIDVAVHSLKDVPTAATPGLEIAAVPLRALPFDVLVTGSAGLTLESLSPGAVVGTSSVRRVAQVLGARPDIVVRPLRGNVDTRLRRLDAGDYDAIVLAGAGLERLGLVGRITEVLQPPRFWPAVGQGALAIQIRAADRRAHAAVLPLDDPPTHSAVRAERACLAALAGGCLAPIGAWSRGTATGKLALGACVLEMAGRTVSRLVVEEDVRDEDESPEGLGARVAAVLVGRGADRMLERMRDPTASATRPDGGTNVTGVKKA